MFSVRTTLLPAGTAMLPRMSAGGWPAATIDFMAVAAGVRWTTVSPATVTLWRDRVGVLPESSAEATVPTTTMNTAMPSTTRAGPRTDMGW